MAATLKNSLYICTVKNQERHEVAAESSVFCVLCLLENNNRIEWGNNGNVPKGFALDTLTARNAVSLCQKLRV